MPSYLHSIASFIEATKTVEPVTPEEFRKGLRIAQCMASYFEIVGLPFNRKCVDKLVEKCEVEIDAGKAPPFNGQQALEIVEGTVKDLWPEMTDCEKDDYIRATDAFASRMVDSAPVEAQHMFAQKVAQQWAQGL